MSACQTLSEDFSASVAAARPLLDQLNAWRSSVPAPPEPSSSYDGGRMDELEPYPAFIHFAYLTLVIYVYRALLRSMVRSSRPPHIIDDVNEILQNPTFSIDDLSWDFSDLRDTNLFPAADIADTHTTAEEVLQAAENSAANVIIFTRCLSVSDVNGFWFSCMCSSSFP